MKILSPRSLGYLLGLSLLMAACTAIPAPDSQPTTMTPISPTTTTTPSEESTPPEADVTEEATAEATSEVTEEATQPETNELADTFWTLMSFGLAGTETPVVGNMPLTIGFSNDGQISGNGGCNSFGGSYSVEGKTLQVDEIISTLVACVDTAMMEQETQYFDALQTASQFQIDGDRLTITYGGEQGTLNFVRTEGITTN